MRAYLPDYDVVRANNLDEALAALAAEALTPLAGGTDIMVLLGAGELPPGRYLSLWNLDELRGITVDDDFTTLGALTTYVDVQRHPTLAAEYPMLVEAARLTGARAIQTRGTLGGNIVNASPAADSPPALMVYDAELELVSARGSRRVPYHRFHSGYKQMDRRPDELLRAIHLPRRPKDERALQYYRKVGQRQAQAISKVVFAGLAVLGADGAVSSCRIALGSVAPTVLRCEAAEQALVGQRPGPGPREAARVAVEAAVKPIDDIRSTARYRRNVSGNLATRFVERLEAANNS